MARQVAVYTGNGNQVFVTNKMTRFIVNINGTDYQQVKSTYSKWFGLYEDYPIILENVNYILAIRDRKMRLVLNGQYIDNGEVFIPTGPLPAWYWAFFVANALILVVSLGGSLNFLISFAGAYFCARTTRANITKTSTKVLLCVGITGIAWVVWLAMQLSIITLFY